MWDAASGEGYTSIEPPEGDINDVLVWPDSGLVMVAGDTARVRFYRGGCELAGLGDAARVRRGGGWAGLGRAGGGGRGWAGAALGCAGLRRAGFTALGRAGPGRGVWKRVA